MIDSRMFLLALCTSRVVRSNCRNIKFKKKRSTKDFFVPEKRYITVSINLKCKYKKDLSIRKTNFLNQRKLHNMISKES